MSNLPYRQPRKPTQYQYEFSQDWGKIWGKVFKLAFLGGFLLWPAFTWGHFDGQEMHWTASAVVASCLWWGFLLMISVPLLLARKAGPPPRKHPGFPDLRSVYGSPLLDPPPGIHPPF
jgi:hypothetical protein